MALKVLAINKKIERKKETLAKLEKEIVDIENRSKALEKEIDALPDTATDGDVDAIAKRGEDLEKELKEHSESRSALKQEIETMIEQRNILEAKNKNISKEPSKKTDVAEMELRKGLNDYLHTRDKGEAKRAGFVSSDGSVVIPTSIVYQPNAEVYTIPDLSTLVTTVPVTTPSGTYPILKKARAKLATVAELAQHPDLAKPEFINVEWKVDTYRGALPLSQESIDDAAVDLLSIVGQNANEQKINTTNALIADQMKAFTSKTVKDLDGLKELINVEIDPAYNKHIVCTQSFYNAIDTLKDTTGNYLLKDDITAASGKQLFGLPLTVIRDTDFGVAGDMKAFVGDPHAGIFNADRQQLNARWVDNDVYGQVLMIGFRGAVKQADASAGYFVTYSPTVAGA